MPELRELTVQPFDIGKGPMMPDEAIMANGRVPMESYTSPERFDLEREMFGRLWLNVAEEAEISRAGDWIVREVHCRSVSVILVRGKDMKVRAFHNICSHRGMKLAWDSAGRGGKFACPYHAWTFDSAGDLINIPDEGCFSHVDKKASGLTPIECDVWGGLIFINLNPDNKQSLVDYLSPVADRLAGIEFVGFPYVARVATVVDANWKLVLEAQHEPYHVSALHSRTVKPMVVAKDNPHFYPADRELMGAHRMQTSPFNPDFRQNPSKLIQNFALDNTAQMFTPDAAPVADEGVALARHPGFNQCQTNTWGSDQFTLFPHFIFHVSSAGWWLHRFWPIDTGRTMWEAVFHYERPASLRQRFALGYTLSLQRDTLMEDNLALVQQQEVMGSGVRPYIQFGELEALCAHLAAVSTAVANDIAAERIAAE